jgi:hypothetical protein
MAAREATAAQQVAERQLEEHMKAALPAGRGMEERLFSGEICSEKRRLRLLT